MKGNLADLTHHRVDTAERSYLLVQREQTAAVCQLADILREQPKTNSSSVLADNNYSDKLVCQVPCEQQAAASDDSSDNIVHLKLQIRITFLSNIFRSFVYVLHSTQCAREHSIFSSSDAEFLTQVFKKTIRSGHIGQTYVMNTLQKSTSGDAFVNRFSIQ